MKKPLLFLAIALLVLSTVHGDVTLGTYTFVPRYFASSSYNPFDDLSYIMSSAKNIVDTCKTAADRRGCVLSLLANLNLAKPGLIWSLDQCVSTSQQQSKSFFSQSVAGLMNECQAADSLLVCGCGPLTVPDKWPRMEFSPRDGGVLMRVFDGDDELLGEQRSIIVPALYIYNAKDKKVEQSDGITLSSRKQCQDKDYCDSSGRLFFVKTPSGVAFVKAADASGLPSCRGQSSRNHFLICVQTAQKFTSTQVQSTITDPKATSLNYRFAITVGSDRRTLKPGIGGDQNVIEQLEYQVARPEYTFSDDDAREQFREYVFGSAYIESGFNHFDPFDGSVIEGHDVGSKCQSGIAAQSIGYGAMQITDSPICPNEFHPSCFNRGGSGICASSPECKGTSALDLTCNVAAGVRFHYWNYAHALEQWQKEDFSTKCNGEITSPVMLTMAYYNGGQGTIFGSDVCSYVVSVTARVEQIFEDAPAITTPSPPPLLRPPVSGGSIYVLGDSLTVGYRSAGLADKLETQGFLGVTINALTGRSLTAGLSELSSDSAAIGSASTIVIALGTNPSGSKEQFTQQVISALDSIRTTNPSASIYWVKVYYTTSPDKSASLKTTYEEYNDALASLSSSKGFGLISLQDALGQYVIDSCIASDPELIHPGSCYGQLADALVQSLAPVRTSCSDPNNLLTYVDKDVALSSSFAPSDLVPFGAYSVRSIVAGPLQSLIDTAAADGITLAVTSGYRSYQTQATLFESYVQQKMAQGMTRDEAIAAVNTDTAVAGHSEHQLGTTVDFNFIDLTDTTDPRVVWLFANAHRFGFTNSYPPGKQALTGYVPEAWHWRYVGTDIATALHNLDYLSTSNEWTTNKYIEENCGLSTQV